MAINALIANSDFKTMTNIDIHNKYNELNETFEDFKKRLMEIGYLEEGDKLARGSENTYFIHKKNEWFLQSRRWWGNHSRKFTFTHLDEDFTKFMKLLDKILGSLIFYLDTRYVDLAKNVREFADTMMTGLYKLKKTYPEEQKLLCKIDSIILAIIDFKTSLTEKLSGKRGRAFSN
jgi:hypothetical protein